MHWMLCLLRLSIHWCLWLLHNTLYRVLWGVKTTLLCIKQEGRLFVETVDMRFIQYSKCSTQNREKNIIQREFMSTLSIHTNPESGFKHTKQWYEIHLVFEMFYSKQREFMLTLSIHAAYNKIRSHPNSCHCICRHCHYIQSNYNVYSNTKTLNYSKVRFKALIYFGLEQTLN